MEKPVQTNDMSLEASVKSRPKLVFLSWSENCVVLFRGNISHKEKQHGLQKLQLLFASHVFEGVCDLQCAWTVRGNLDAQPFDRPNISKLDSVILHMTSEPSALPLLKQMALYTPIPTEIKDLRRKQSDHQLD